MRKGYGTGPVDFDVNDTRVDTASETTTTEYTHRTYCKPVFDTSDRGISPSFGNVLDEVALALPISKSRLADAIDRFDDAVRRRERHVRREGNVYVYPSAILVDLRVEIWEEIESDAGLLPFETVAVRAAHHRFATALVGKCHERAGRSLLILATA